MSNYRNNLSLSANASRLNLGTRSAAVLASLDKGTQAIFGRHTHPCMRVTTPVDVRVWELVESMPFSIMDSPGFRASAGCRYQPGPERAGVEFEASRRVEVVPVPVPGVVPTPPSLPASVTAFCSAKAQPGQPKPKQGWLQVTLSGRVGSDPAAWTRNPAPDPAALRAAGG